MSYEDFDAVLDVHLRGAFHVVRPAFPLMCDAGYGRIVLTSSIGGLYGNHDVANYAAAKAGIIGLTNVAALEGAAEGVKCNVIVPGAVTRMAEGIDTSAYPPMGPELVAPAVGWLAHESCSVTGELFVAIAGRIARAFIAETPGVYRPSWSIEDVGEQIDAIRTTPRRWSFPPFPTGTSTTSGTASGWRAQGAGMAERERGPLARRARRRSHRDGDGPVLHADHGRHGRRRDQGRAARRRQHPLHLGRPGAGDERRVRQRQPRQAQRRARSATPTRARPRCAR